MSDSGNDPIPPAPASQPPLAATAGKTNAAMAQNPIAAMKSEVTLSEGAPSPAPMANTANPISMLPAMQPKPMAGGAISGGTTKESQPRMISEAPPMILEPAASTERPVEQMEEIPTQVELEKKPELQGYVEKVEHDTELQTPVQDDYAQQVLLKSANPQNVVVTLPLTEEQVVMGLHEQVWSSLRWLAEWCVRQIKLLHGRVKYRGEE